MLLYSLRATPGVLLPAKVYCMYLNKEGGFSFSPIHQIQYDSCICHQCSPIVQFVLGIFFGNRDITKVLIMCEAVFCGISLGKIMRCAVAYSCFLLLLLCQHFHFIVNVEKYSCFLLHSTLYCSALLPKLSFYCQFQTERRSWWPDRGLKYHCGLFATNVSFNFAWKLA